MIHLRQQHQLVCQAPGQFTPASKMCFESQPPQYNTHYAYVMLSDFPLRRSAICHITDNYNEKRCRFGGEFCCIILLTILSFDMQQYLPLTRTDIVNNVRVKSVHWIQGKN